MIIGIDIGGTKTLIASFASDGQIEKEHQFETPRDYNLFIAELKHHLATFTNHSAAKICCIGVPGLLNRKKGIVHSLGNLPWVEEPIAADIADALPNTKIIIENDSKLAGLAEVRAVETTPARALYLTISTGIGGALFVNGHLSKDMLDMELGKSPLEFDGQQLDWEDFAGGRPFVEHYGKKGDDVNDNQIWQSYAQDRLGPGVAVACAYLQVDTIIFGGGLGHHSSHFNDYLSVYLDERLHSIVSKPTTLRSARFGKNAVIHGCYEYAKDHLA